MSTSAPPELQALQERIRSFSGSARKRLAQWIDAQPSASDEILTAYYVTAAASPLEATDLRSFLAERLPAHMVPGVLVPLDALPRNTHGKLDRTALPAPFASQPMPSAAPASELEAAVLGIWRDLLGMDRVDLEDSFFEIGGDSLLGIRLLGQIRDRWQIDLPMQALFDHPTAAATAAHIQAVLWARDSELTEGDGTPGEREEVEF